MSPALAPPEFKFVTFGIDLAAAHVAYREGRLPEGFTVEYKDTLVIR
jgi:hypothetical protein